MRKPNGDDDFEQSEELTPEAKARTALWHEETGPIVLLAIDCREDFRALLCSPEGRRELADYYRGVYRREIAHCGHEATAYLEGAQAIECMNWPKLGRLLREIEHRYFADKLASHRATLRYARRIERTPAGADL